MEFFPNIKKVNYEGKDSTNPYAYRFYDAERIVLGKPMKDQLRFAVAYWHTMTEDGKDPFGAPVHERNWESPDPMKTAENRVEAAFELFEKLGVEYFAFHDVDIAPEGDSLEEFLDNLDHITDLIKVKMDETGIKLLWNTANLFTHPRFVHGAATSPNPDVFAYSAAQIKKGLDISKKLGGQNYVFWGGREGYDSLLHTDMKFELDNLARMLHMSVDYCEKINHKPQLLIEPKPMEPTKHQYDFDAATTISFLRTYGLENDFKLNLEANHATLAGHTFEHEIRVARDGGFLGSLDANQGDLLLGWDVDEFPTNTLDTTLAMYEVMKNGGIAPGGINFDAKVRRSSFSQDDLILGHIAGMDTFARALLSVEKIMEDKFFDKILNERYSGFNEEIGKKILADEMDFESLTEYALKNKKITNKSGHLEFHKSKLNDYLV